MNVDDFVKLTLAIGFTFSLVGISFQIMRLIGKLTASIQDLRKTFQNVSTVSDMAVEDYRKIRGVLDTVLDLASNVQNILTPLKTVGGLLSMFNRKKEEEVDEESAV